MNNKIRMALLSMNSELSQCFYIDIPNRGRIEFFRQGDYIFIVNPNDPSGKYISFERLSLKAGETEEERDELFAKFLENVENLHLVSIGL